MDKEERKFFERMSKALEEMTKALEQISRDQKRLADAQEKQRPSKADQFLTTAAAIGTTIGGFTVVDLLIKWFTGG